MPSSATDPTTRLEIQIHPGDIRRKVKYFFLSRRQIVWGVAAALVYLAFLAAGAALAPRVVASILNYQEYRDLQAERAERGARLQELLEELETLEQQSNSLRLTMNKIFLAYGLRSDEAISGQGGYPFEARPAPESIYAKDIRQGNELEAQVHEQMRVLEIFMDEVQSFEETHREQVLFTPSIYPLASEDSVPTSPFGNRRNPFTKAMDFHAGLDIAAPVGTPIQATADGEVVFAGRYPMRRSVAWWRYGNLVIVKNGPSFVTLFAHCDEVKVRKGQKVKQGDLLATVGNTGLSTNPHLHYEVRRRGEDGDLRPVDPLIYILNPSWDDRDEERLLIRARNSSNIKDFEPLPRSVVR